MSSALLGIAAVWTCLCATPTFAAVEPVAESPIAGDPIKFKSEDGVELLGHLFKAKATPLRGAILFVHEPFRSQRDWSYLADKMARRGFTTLIFDLRGHGQSLMQKGAELDREVFGPAEYAAMTLDVEAALGVLRKAAPDTERIHFIGADLGGSLALLTAVKQPTVKSVAMVSPGLGYDEVNIVGKAAEFARPLLLVYSVEDGYSRKSVEVIEKEARGPLHTETYYGVGHGTKMLSREPALESFLQSWFLGTVINAEGQDWEDTGKPLTGEKDVEGTIDAEAEKRKAIEQRSAISEGAVQDDGEDQQGKKLGTARD